MRSRRGIAGPGRLTSFQRALNSGGSNARRKPVHLRFHRARPSNSYAFTGLLFEDFHPRAQLRSEGRLLAIAHSVGAALRRGWLMARVQIEDGRVVLPINHVMCHLKVGCRDGGPY
jgi:hypothetical protein